MNASKNSLVSICRQHEGIDFALRSVICGFFGLILVVSGSGAQRSVLALRLRTSCLKPDETLEVFGEVCRRGLNPCVGDADRADEQPCAVPLPAEHVLNRKAGG